MVTYQTLKISIHGNDIKNYVSLLYKQALAANYIRLIDIENKLVEDRLLEHTYICLQTPRIHVENQYLEAIIWLSIELNQVVLRNITSNQRSFLSADEYNIILNNFYKDVILKIKFKGIKRQLSKPTFDLRDVMGKKCSESLIRFSNIANKDSVLVNESDIECWAKFVKLAHRSNARITYSQLEQWLNENGWRKEDAEEIASYYEYTISLLKYV